jgi:4-hydroxybenzoate polyprenyltransferase
MFGTGISLLTAFFVLEYPHWRNILYWNILAGGICYTGTFLTGGICCTGTFLTGGICCTGISSLAEYFVLEYPRWRNILYWNILTGGICCTGTFLTGGIFCTGTFVTGWLFGTGISYPY